MGGESNINIHIPQLTTHPCARPPTQWYHRPVRAIALVDTDFATKRMTATGGLAGQLVVSSRGWFVVDYYITTTTLLLLLYNYYSIILLLY